VQRQGLRVEFNGIVGGVSVVEEEGVMKNARKMGDITVAHPISVHQGEQNIPPHPNQK